MPFSFTNPLFRKGRQVRGITGVPRGGVQTYEPFFTNPRHWANFIIGPKESGKFTLVCNWLGEWRRKNRLDRLVVVSAKRSAKDPLAKFFARVNLNSPDWINDLDGLVALKAETAPLETWAIVLDQCFWQPWVLKHRLIRRLMSQGKQLRIGLFCLFERPPQGLDANVKDYIDTVVALPYQTLEGWKEDLVSLTGGRFVPSIWDDGEHPKHTLWAWTQTRGGSVPYTIRPIKPADNLDFGPVEMMLGSLAVKQPYATAPQAKEGANVPAKEEPEILPEKEDEDVPAATWWDALASWIPPLPAIGLFSAWSEA